MVREGFTDRGKEKVDELLFRAGLRLESKIKRKLTENGTVSSGVLRSSYQTVREGDRVVVGSPLEYAKYVEFGTGPRNKFPPFEAIRDWVVREIKPDDVDSVTWAVMNKIKEEGTEAQPHVRPAIDELRNELGSGKTF